MIYVTNNAFAVLLSAFIWALDGYLVIVGLRLILGQATGVGTGHLRYALQDLTDPIHRAFSAQLNNRRKTDVPAWVPWLLIIMGLVVVRQILVQLIISVL